jgi:AAA15 family ATPase/GTPase
MIVSFSVANFRSFASEETLSLVASKRVADQHHDHAVPIPDSKEQVLRVAVLYGANGAGKSNLFNALRYMESLALNTRSRKQGTGREPFRFAELHNAPSSFDLQFIASDKLFRFGLKIDDERVIEEWLYRIINGKEKVIYERTTSEEGSVVIQGEGLKEAGPKVEALATIGGPQNQSFLATVNATLENADWGEELGDVLAWFNESLTLIAPEQYYGSLAHFLDQNPGFQSFASSFLKASSTGVDHLEVEKHEVSKEDLRKLLPSGVVSRILRALEEDNGGIVRLYEGTELVIERQAEDRFYAIEIQAAHEQRSGSMIKLDLGEESDGTRRLLNLLPALYDMRTRGSVYFIDEIDRSLHPILVKEFLQFFLRSCDSSCRQLIVTTHESNLLDLDLLRRDEIWFAEKDESASTRLYSLLDFKVRNDLEIRKHYLQGRFGAIPFLGNLEQLLGQPELAK